MKRILAVISAVTVMAAATSWGATVKNTKHDLSTGATGNLGASSTGGSDQICKYCHTPHNPQQAIPLWNRANISATAFKFYSSPTMSLNRPVALTDKFEATSISLFCMSCHDGGTLGARIHNGAAAITGTLAAPSATVPNITTDAITDGTKGDLGTDLSNDHPVNLQLAATTAEMNNAIYAPAGDGRSITDGITTLPLFKGASGSRYLECSSCHAVHDNTTAAPFLRVANTNSKLCLACHKK